MNQVTKWVLLMKKNRSQKSRASVPLNGLPSASLKAATIVRFGHFYEIFTKAFYVVEIQTLPYVLTLIKNGLNIFKPLAKNKFC